MGDIFSFFLYGYLWLVFLLGGVSTQVLWSAFNQAVHLIVQFKNFLHILHDSPVSHMFLANIFPSVCSLSCHYQGIVFLRADIFDFIEVYNYFFYFL